MMLYHVVATSLNRVIGKDNKLPWHFPADLKNFKNLTTGQTVIMGRKTFESIGKPLPHRENFVITSKLRPDQDRLKFFSSIEEALTAIKTSEGFIIGGAQIYKQTFDKINGIYLTQIYESYEGDAYYPEIPKDFHEAARSRIQENPILDVILYQKRSNCGSC